MKSEWFIRTTRTRMLRVIRPESGKEHQVFDRTYQSSSKPEEFHVVKFEDEKNSSEFFEGRDRNYIGNNVFCIYRRM